MNLTVKEMVRVMGEHDLVFTGESALEQFDQKLQRIGPKRWESFLYLLKQIKYFGGITLVASEQDTESEYPIKTLEWHPDDDDLVGLYRTGDKWIELIVSRMTSWERLEAVLRHEFVHMLQDITYKGDRTDCSAWSTEGNLLRPYGKRAARFSDPVEAEAYWLMNRPGEVKREAMKVQNDPERWNNWYTSLANPNDGTTNE